MKKGVFFTLVLLLSVLTFGQQGSHNNVWSRLSLAYPFSNQFKVEAELQKRWQNDLTVDNSKNPFQEDLMNSIRLWANYKYNPKFNFSLSPFAYFQHTSIITKESDKSKSKTYEVRYTIASDFKQKIISKTYFFDRLALEYRDFKNNNTDDILRLRNKLGMKYEFNSKWAISGFDELFLNLNSDDHKHLYDHNRIGVLGNYAPSKSIKIELGYVAISRLPKTKDELMHENNFLVMLYYTFNQHKK